MVSNLLANVSDMILSVAVVVLVGYGIVWLAFICVRYEPRQWWMRLLDAESYPRGPFFDAFGDAIRDRLRRPRRRTLMSPKARYQLRELLGHGDVCDVYQADCHGNRVVLKLPRVATCNRLLANEQMVLRRLHRESGGDAYGRYFPVPVDSFVSEARSVSAFEYQDGLFSAEQIRRRYPGGVGGRHVAWMLNRTLEALGFAHSHGIVHGAVLPPHLLFHVSNHGLQLIDWIHATSIGSPLRVVPKRFKGWYPVESRRRDAASPAIDIYLAAQSMIWIAGGDPTSDVMPEHLPIEFRCFLCECLAQKRSDGQRAWSLHSQLRQLLEDLYGPPKFCHLEMS